MYTIIKIKNYIEVYGWKQLLIIPFRRIQRKLFVIKKGIVYYFIPANIPKKNFDQSIIVRRATIDDLGKLKVFKSDTTLYRDWLKNNEIFIIALIDEKVVGQICITNDQPKENINFIKFKLKSEEAYVREGFIHPKYRNMGIYSIIFSFAAQIAERQGYSRVYGDITSNNQKSREIHTKKFGFIPVFSYMYVKLPFFEKTWVSEIQH